MCVRLCVHACEYVRVCARFYVHVCEYVCMWVRACMFNWLVRLVVFFKKQQIIDKQTYDSHVLTSC